MRIKYINQRIYYHGQIYLNYNNKQISYRNKYYSVEIEMRKYKQK